MSTFSPRSADTHQRIMGALKSQPEGATVLDLLAMTGLSDSTLREWLKWLCMTREIFIAGHEATKTRRAAIYKLEAVVEKVPDGLLRRKSHCKHKKPLLDEAPRHPAPIAMYGAAYQ